MATPPTTLPKTTRAIQISQTGSTSVLTHVPSAPLPAPKAGEVLIKNDYIGINYIDTYFRTGLYPAPHFPYTLGREGSGTVVAVGGSDADAGESGAADTSSALKAGTRVAYLAQAAYAEYTIAPTTHTIALPPGVDTRTGAAALLQGLTAVTLIREAHHVNRGDWVLVHAAAGGMGLWLCQLLKRVGARTIGTASSESKRGLAKENGAEVVLPYPDSSETSGQSAFVSRIKDLTDGQGVSVVFDGVGAATFDVSLECVARKGSLISFGNASGAVPPFAISRLSAKNIRLMRPTLFNFIATREEFEVYAGELMGMIGEEGSGNEKVDVRVHEVYEFGEEGVRRAHEDIEGRGTVGKLLMKV